MTKPTLSNRQPRYAARVVPLSVIEYFAAAFIACFGLWVLLWGPDAALSAHAFDELTQSAARFGPAWRVIGGGGLLVGAVYGLAIKINGRGAAWTPIVRGVSCVFAVAFLMNLVVSIAQQQPSSTGVYSYGFLTVAYAGLFVANLNRFAHALELIWGRIRGLA
ncbi:hypothetical protein [Yoonia sp. 208BN28-4]|uniref:hypothetical protein n=1 Tax=Yoonia sp. 208BN28-4 TaxID=3126505 RepID=UPI0030B5D36A